MIQWIKLLFFQFNFYCRNCKYTCLYVMCICSLLLVVCLVFAGLFFLSLLLCLCWVVTVAGLFRTYVSIQQVTQHNALCTLHFAVICKQVAGLFFMMNVFIQHFAYIDTCWFSLHAYIDAAGFHYMLNTTRHTAQHIHHLMIQLLYSMLLWYSYYTWSEHKYVLPCLFKHQLYSIYQNTYIRTHSYWINSDLNIPLQLFEEW